MKKNFKRAFAMFLAGALVLTVTACQKKESGELIIGDEEKEKTVVMFTPMERTNPEVDNTARTAHEITVSEAEKALGVRVEYNTYTALDYQEKTYDDVTLERARGNLDDIYRLNPDTIQILGAEGLLEDLSSLPCAANLRDVVKAANTVNGKLVAIPQEIVAYGLFVNKDMFDEYDLEMPNTPEEFLDCCRVFKENGIETPVGANRWWLENFVLAIGYDKMYNTGDTEAEIAALNSGAAKMSDYMRPGFEFLQELIDKGYIDAEKAYTSEAIDGEGPDFLAQKTPIVMAYWGAANTPTAYGDPDFNMEVIGFPSSLGQMPVISMIGFGVGIDAAQKEDALAVLDYICSDEMLQRYTEVDHVISPSKNVERECIDALKPLNNRINEGFYVLGSNAGMKVEQWGNICLIVRDLLNGATIDECMASFDKLQADSLR